MARDKVISLNKLAYAVYRALGVNNPEAWLAQNGRSGCPVRAALIAATEQAVDEVVRLATLRIAAMSLPGTATGQLIGGVEGAAWAWLHGWVDVGERPGPRANERVPAATNGKHAAKLRAE